MTALSESLAVKRGRFPSAQLDERLADARGAELARILDAARAAHSAAPMEQHDDYVTRLRQRVENGEVRSFDHLLVLARNQFERAAAQQDVEAVFHAYLSIIASWYEPAVESACIKDASKDETIAEGPANVAQIDIDKAEGADLAARERRLAEHNAKSGRLLRFVRRRLYGARSTSAA